MYTYIYIYIYVYIYIYIYIAHYVGSVFDFPQIAFVSLWILNHVLKELVSGGVVLVLLGTVECFSNGFLFL